MRTGPSVLGVVPQELSGVDLPTMTKSTSNRAGAYRTIRTNVQFAGPAHSLKTILITSATAGDGKTSVATNLAVAFAATGQSVVLVDGDLRRHRVGEAFGLRTTARIGRRARRLGHARRRAALGPARAAGSAAGRVHAGQPERAARQHRDVSAAQGAGRALRGRGGRQSAGAARDRPAGAGCESHRSGGRRAARRDQPRAVTADDREPAEA